MKVYILECNTAFKPSNSIYNNATFMFEENVLYEIEIYEIEIDHEMGIFFTLDTAIGISNEEKREYFYTEQETKVRIRQRKIKKILD